MTVRERRWWSAPTPGFWKCGSEVRYEQIYAYGTGLRPAASDPGLRELRSIGLSIRKSAQFLHVMRRPPEECPSQLAVSQRTDAGSTYRACGCGEAVLLLHMRIRGGLRAAMGPERSSRPRRTHFVVGLCVPARMRLYERRRNQKGNISPDAVTGRPYVRHRRCHPPGVTPGTN